MKKKILNGFDGLTLFEKLKRFETDLVELDLLIDSIEDHKNEGNGMAGFVKKFIDLKRLKKIGQRINRFLRYPMMDHKPGHPLEYPDSHEEKTRYQSYRREGISIREIARMEKMSPDTVSRKLKKYRIP